MLLRPNYGNFDPSYRRGVRCESYRIHIHSFHPPTHPYKGGNFTKVGNTLAFRPIELGLNLKRLHVETKTKWNPLPCPRSNERWRWNTVRRQSPSRYYTYYPDNGWANKLHGQWIGRWILWPSIDIDWMRRKKKSVLLFGPQMDKLLCICNRNSTRAFLLLLYLVPRVFAISALCDNSHWMDSRHLEINSYMAADVVDLGRLFLGPRDV